MDSDAWSALLYTWAPILLMIGFWLFFMWKFKKQTNKQATHTERSLTFMDRQEQLLERIAIALERRNGQ
jgi:hypothetical protein